LGYTPKYTPSKAVLYLRNERLEKEKAPYVGAFKVFIGFYWIVKWWGGGN
jgi:hypothetical protein